MSARRSPDLNIYRLRNYLCLISCRCVRLARVFVDHTDIGSCPLKDVIHDLALPKAMELVQRNATLVTKN